MKAFTLLETIIVIFIFSFILITIVLIILNFSNYYTFIVSDIVKQAEVDLTLKEIENEIKSMVNSKKGSYPLEKAVPSEIIFYKDFENDGTPEKIRYFVETNSFRKQVFLYNSSTLDYEPSPAIDRILVEDLSTSTVFKYFDKNSQETSNIADVRIIEISLTSVIRFPDKIYRNYLVVVPRNLKEK